MNKNAQSLKREVREVKDARTSPAASARGFPCSRVRMYAKSFWCFMRSCAHFCESAESREQRRRENYQLRKKKSNQTKSSQLVLPEGLRRASSQACSSKQEKPPGPRGWLPRRP